MIDYLLNLIFHICTILGEQGFVLQKLFFLVMINNVGTIHLKKEHKLLFVTHQFGLITSPIPPHFIFYLPLKYYLDIYLFEKSV